MWTLARKNLFKERARLAIATLRWIVPILLLLPFAVPHLRRDWREIRAHWAILQVTAWTGMIVARTQTAGVVEAVADRRRLFQRLVAEKRLGWFGEAPVPPQPDAMRRDLERAVQSLRALMA